MNGFAWPECVYVLRHGQTDWNVEHRLQGHSDIPLNSVGKQQARVLGEKLRGELGPSAGAFEYYSSPLVRAHDTMRIVMDCLGDAGPSIVIDKRLVELGFGDWEGKTFSELRQIEPVEVENRFKDKWHYRKHNGENYEILWQRVRPFFSSLVRKSVVVCHSGVIRVLLSRLEGRALDELEKQDVPQDKILRLTRDTILWI